MAQIIHTEFKVDLQIKSIELLKSSINLPANPDVSLNTFNFDINLESRADATDKLVFVIVSVDITSEDQDHTMGSLVASCIYSISDFEEMVKIEPDGKVTMPQAFTEIINSISISTVRGIMFSTFKGTFLHNAYLPIVAPRSFMQG